MEDDAVAILVVCLKFRPSPSFGLPQPNTEPCTFYSPLFKPQLSHRLNFGVPCSLWKRHNKAEARWAALVRIPARAALSPSCAMPATKLKPVKPWFTVWEALCLLDLLEGLFATSSTRLCEGCMSHCLTSVTSKLPESRGRPRQEGLIR